jgi:hypothetical protein
MSKKNFGFLALLGLAVLAYASGADVAKTTVRLVPDRRFGAGVDWNSVFPQYPGGGSHRATYKDFVRLSDGRFFVIDSRTYNFLVFDADGKFIKKLWKKGRRNPDDLSIYNRPEWLSLWADKYLFVSELGVVRVFDLKGREIRHVVIDHTVECLFPLNEGRVAVAGWVLRKDLPIRYLVAVVDLEKGAETVVMDSIESRPTKKDDVLDNENGKKDVTISLPHAQIRPFVRPTSEGGFLAGFTNWPEIEVYDKTGKPIRTYMLKTNPAVIEWAQIAVLTPRRMEWEAEIAKSLPVGKDGKVHFFGSGRFPIQREPYFYNLYNDKSGNLLVFFFPSEGTNPVYQVYSPAGELLREVVVETGDYLIPFSPGGAGALFTDESLYTLAEKRGAKEPSLQLMKFKMVEQ